MQRMDWRAILIVMIGALPALCPAAPCEATIRVGAPPIEEELDQSVLRAVADRLSWCLIWDGRETNITRRLAMIRDGDLDLIYDASKTEERASYSWFSNKYRDETVQLYVRSDEAVRYQSIRSFDDLLDTKAALVSLRNAWMGPDYARHRNDLLASKRVYEVERFVQARGMLLMHHADVFIAADSFAGYLQREGESRIVALDWQPYHAPVYYMFSRKTVGARQIEQFNHALAEVQRKPKER
jgi:polar amino acid transport system substrate-binding protein